MKPDKPNERGFKISQITHRVIRLVFPTDWSPSNTIFVRFSGDDEKSAEAGVPGVAIEERGVQEREVECVQRRMDLVNVEADGVLLRHKDFVNVSTRNELVINTGAAVWTGW